MLYAWMTARRRTGRQALRHGPLRAYAQNPQEVNRFKWVVKDRKYFRSRCTPGGGPPFLVEAGERWLDVGANVGYFAALALSEGARSMTCVEAEKENIVRLRRNLKLGGADRKVRVVRALVRGRLGRSGKLLLSRKTTRHSALAVPEAGHSGAAQLVPCVTTLRRLLGSTEGGPYDALKINIEGAEREVLLAMRGSSWGRELRKMVVEYSFDIFPKRGDFDELLTHLRATGWRVFPESVPSWFSGKDAVWDRRKTLGNDARQIWAFRGDAGC